MKRLAYGGSFNPIHFAHLRCAQMVAEHGGFDQVVLIPAAISPLKTGQTDVASPTDRLAMCRLATKSSPLFAVDDLEIRRTGPSYTIDTIRTLKRRGWDDIFWLIGSDQLPLLPKWHQPRAILTEATLLVMARPGWAFDWERLPPPFRVLRNNVVPAPLVDISATEIRRRVREGLPIDDLTPPPVIQYIHEHGLYRD